MKRYLKIYRFLISLNLSNLMAYRANFISSFVGTTVWGLFHFISIFVLTYRVNSVYGWTKEELYLLTAAFSIMWGVFRLLFIQNFEDFSSTVLEGKLDGFLLKPIDSQFLMSLWRITYVEVGRIIMGIAFMLYVIPAYHVQVTAWSVTLFFCLIFFSMMSAYALWFSVLTIIIWFPRLTNLMEFLYMAAGLIRYPADMVRGFGEYTVFFLAPFIFILSTPVKSLVGKMSFLDIGWLIVFSLLFLVFSRAFWKHALKSYTSVNS